MSSCPLSANSIGCPCEVTTIPPFGPFLGCGSAKPAVVIIAINSANNPCLNILVLLSLDALKSLGRRKRTGLRRGEPLEWPLAESEEKHGREDGVEQCRAQKPAEDGDCEGMQDFPSRLVGAEQQRGQRKTSGKRRHQHRRQPLQAASDNKGSPETFAFVQGQIDIVR